MSHLKLLATLHLLLLFGVARESLSFCLCVWVCDAEKNILVGIIILGCAIPIILIINIVIHYPTFLAWWDKMWWDSSLLLLSWLVLIWAHQHLQWFRLIPKLQFQESRQMMNEWVSGAVWSVDGGLGRVNYWVVSNSLYLHKYYHIAAIW